MPVDLKLRTHRHQAAVRKAAYWPKTTTATFDIVLLDAGQQGDGDRQALTWTLTRLDTNWQWYRRDGNWTYEAVTVKTQGRQWHACPAR